MNPFDALSAAAAIAQLLAYGIELTSTAVHIYRSPHGASKQMLQLEQMATTFRDRAEETLLKAHRGRTPGLALDPSEAGLARVALLCKTTVAELLQLLQKLKVNGSKTFVKSWYMAIKISGSHKDMAYFQQQMDDLRQQLNEQILSMMRYESLFGLRLRVPYSG